MCFKEKENNLFSSQKNSILFNRKYSILISKKKILLKNFGFHFFLHRKLLRKIINLSWSKKIFSFILKLKSMVKNFFDSSQFKKKIILLLF